MFVNVFIVVSEQKHEVVAHALCYMYLFLFLPSVTVGMRLDKLFYTSMECVIFLLKNEFHFNWHTYFR